MRIEKADIETLHFFYSLCAYVSWKWLLCGKLLKQGKALNPFPQPAA